MLSILLIITICATKTRKLWYVATAIYCTGFIYLVSTITSQNTLNPIWHEIAKKSIMFEGMLNTAIIIMCAIFTGYKPAPYYGEQKE